MDPVPNIVELSPHDRDRVGGKAVVLGLLDRAGFDVPYGVVVPVAYYRSYLASTGLAAQIHMELGRKEFSDMRWEEIWDASLRIRNLFLRTPIPKRLEEELLGQVPDRLQFGPVVVRSSAPAEDATRHSFAGMHESLVNVAGRDALLQAIRTVWSSLWSDRSLLYRLELGLDVRASAMAVLVQELICGRCSGVAFSQSPMEPRLTTIEAVWGLNAGLVDGTVEPDAWDLDRDRSHLVDTRTASRRQHVVPVSGGLTVVPLPPSQQASPPLNPDEVVRLQALVLRIEETFGAPQDVEWTCDGNRLWILQARPVTTGRNRTGDSRAEYLRLHRSFEELKQIRRKVEEELMPAMEREAEFLAAIDPTALDDAALHEEVRRRRRILERWEGAYRRWCIPMAHGVRLFATFYNDVLRPEDPFEFVELLRGGGLRAVLRNERLLREARGDSAPGRVDVDEIARSFYAGLEASGFRPVGSHRSDTVPERSTEHFLQRFPAKLRGRALEMLDMGRASYRLRDDDNISLGLIRSEVEKAEAELFRRHPDVEKSQPEKSAERGFHPASRILRESRRVTSRLGQVRVRQYQGQPASAGVASGPARVVSGPEDLSSVKPGDVLVCDAIDPNMTFVVPVVAAIVERRGGMLIHGAIIAREYGIPCVTGIVEATRIIGNGDPVTVDGYLGLVTIGGVGENGRPRVRQ